MVCKPGSVGDLGGNHPGLPGPGPPAAEVTLFPLCFPDKTKNKV